MLEQELAMDALRDEIEALKDENKDLKNRTGLVWKEQPEHFIKTLADGDIIYGHSRYKIVGKRNQSRGKNITVSFEPDFLESSASIEMIRLSNSYLYKLKNKSKTPEELIGKEFLIHGEDVYVKVCEDLATYIPKLISKGKDFGFDDQSGDRNNVLIEGDNYHALQVLQHTHAGSVDCIVIDPPYNTGKKDFKYNDNFVHEESGNKHSSWLSFMEKRLILAKKLLKKTGCILVSIDRHESSRLNLLMDSVFGADNHVQTFIKETAGGTNNSKLFSERHEFLYMYSVSSSFSINPAIELKEKKFQIFSKWGGISDIEDRPNRGFPIYVNKETGELSLSDIDPICTVKGDSSLTLIKLSEMRELEDAFYEAIGKENFIQVYPKYRKKGEKITKNGYWRWQKKGLNDKLSKLTYKKSKTFGDYIYEIVEGGNKEINRPSIIPAFGQGGAQLAEILGDSSLFSYPKSIDYIKYLLSFFTADALCLDFFAGSGTVGQAAWELNKEDGGNRKFILVTNNENNICEDVTYERLRRSNLPEHGNYQEGLEYVKIEHVSTDEVSGHNNEHNIDFTRQLVNFMHGSYKIIEDNDDWFANSKCAILKNISARNAFFERFSDYEHIGLLAHKTSRFKRFVSYAVEKNFSEEKISHFTKDYVENMKRVLEEQEVKQQQELALILKQKEEY